MKKINLNILLIFILIIFSIPLRFINLGYSDYIGDEHKAFLELEPNQNTWNFFMTRRKGPMQFLVSLIPYSITGDYTNELAQRIPFSIISVFAVIAFYLMAEKLTRNKFIAFISSVLYLVNGFIVGFGRIAQYQNLNLLFSFLSLYFYASLLYGDKDHRKDTLLGTLFFSLSLLSHWDVIFILPVVLYIFASYLINKKIVKKEKIKILFHNFVLGCVLLLPFLIPYIFYQSSHQANMDYFGRRIEIGYFNKERYQLLFEVYNPFVVFWFIASLSIIGLIGVKKNYPFVLWFVFSYGIFELFVRKPGTHIYNFVVPAIILCSFGIYYVFKIFPKYLKVIPGLFLLIFLSFFYYQTYLIFVDHSVEYPKDRKEILNFTTPAYDIKQKLPLFGFPYKRDWNMINDWVNEQNRLNNENFTYITNEVKTISEWYMDVNYGIAKGGFYAIGIKEPLSFVEDWRHTNISGKKLVQEFQNEYGETVVNIYRIHND